MSTYEKSCGAVVVTRLNQELRYVIIRSLAGDYGFPKGHCETGETEQETALREIWEETGLSVRLDPEFRYVDEYPIPGRPGVMKRIVYFLAAYEDQQIRYQVEELSWAGLMRYEEAMEAFQWESSRMILHAASDYLSNT